MQTNKTLLIVDDESLIIDLLMADLQCLGYRIEGYPDGIEALARVTRQHELGPVHAIVSDINMKEMDGFALLKTLRSLGYETPLLFLTACADKHNAIQALRLGAVDFIEKPYDPARMREVVQYAMNLGVALNEVESAIVREVASKPLALSPDSTIKELVKAVLRLKTENHIRRKRTG